MISYTSKGQNKNSTTNLFSRIYGWESGVIFSNTIRESGIYNHIAWENVYHGAGVAIGDINNDGLPDIYFSGNQVKDKLFLNKGNFKFEDISENVELPSIHQWSSGVIMVDVNNDGYLDIYVCKSGFSLNPIDRKNLLFINNKNLTFTEKSAEYGLDDSGYSMQAAFFDYDNDGDLDAYIMNQPPSTIQEKMQDRISSLPCDVYTDRLLQNDLDTKGKFVDVTSLSNIQNCAYGLGISVVDINEDGWNDIYIANDYFASDYLYINQKNKSFKDESAKYFKHLSLYAMGCDVGDVNSDGLMDLFTADMSSESHYRNKANMPSMNIKRFKDIIASGFDYQYMFNTLQLNNGAEKFSDIAQMVGIANTDWTWGALLMDAENDGDLDLFATNGIKKEVRNVDALNELRRQLADGSIKLSEILKITPSEKLKNYAYENEGNLKFSKAEKWNFDLSSFSNGISYGDLDNDGDLDIVISNVDDQPFFFKNNSDNNYLRIQLKGEKKNPFAYGAKVKLYYDGKINYQTLNPVRGYLSSSEPILHFGLGNSKHIDKIEIFWPNGTMDNLTEIAVNQLLKVDYNPNNVNRNLPQPLYTNKIFQNYSKLNFRHKEIEFNDFEKEVLLPYKLSQLGPALAKGDVNSDGLDDFYIGGAKNQAGKLYIQSEKGFYEAPNQPWLNEKKYEESGAKFFHLNNDNHLDLYIASGSNEFHSGDISLKDRVYLGDGKGNFKLFPAFSNSLPISTKAIEIIDFDFDGDTDVFVGGRLSEQQYPRSPKSFLFENREGKLVDVISQVVPELEYAGMITSASVFEESNQKYIAVVGEWMPIRIFKINAKKWIEVKDDVLSKSVGLWQYILPHDFDKDGDMDFIVGNFGENSKFKVDDENEFHLFANDFDLNGSLDIVLGQKSKKRMLPIRGRQCSSEQMPFIKTKFPTYHKFASATLDEIYSTNKLEGSIHYKIDLLSSVFIENKDGKYIITPLPKLSQVSPIMIALVDDYDNDNEEEVVCFGNLYEMEVETTRLDGSYGIFMEFINGKWVTYDYNLTGLAIEGNVKSAIKIKGKKRNYIAVGINDGDLKMLAY